MAGLTAGSEKGPAALGQVIGGLAAAQQIAATIEAVPAESEERLEFIRAMRNVDAPPAAAEVSAARREELDRAAERLIPRRFRAAQFGTYRPKTPSQRAALESVQEWTERVRQGKGGMLALLGQQGTGKSHLLYAAVNALMPWAIGAVSLYARPWYLLADELRYGGPGIWSHNPREAHQVRHELWTAGIVLLDEIRPTSATAFDDTELAKLACHCWDQQIPVLITTNVSPLDRVMGPAAASRFVEVEIVGPDARKAA